MPIFYTHTMSPLRRVRRLRLRDLAPRGGCFHLARAEYPRGASCAVHRHDFAEVFWIERGRALHLIGRQRRPIDAGTVVLIRPDDAHGLRSTVRGGFTLVNVAFERQTLDFLRDRYFDRDPRWFAAGGAMPACWSLPPSLVPALAERVERLSMARQSRLDLECFLLRLFQMLRDATPAAGHADPAADPARSGAGTPDWLAQTITRFTQRPELHGGAWDLAALAGCSVAHLNRVVRHHYGLTTTGLINQIRLEHAARGLRMSPEPIARIALRCGYQNLGYFYRCFTRRFGKTPRHYRLAGQTPIRA